MIHADVFHTTYTTLGVITDTAHGLTIVCLHTRHGDWEPLRMTMGDKVLDVPPGGLKPEIVDALDDAYRTFGSIVSEGVRI